MVLPVPDLDHCASVTDLERPNPARVGNALLGGSHNFAADRRAAAELLAADPAIGVRLRVRRTALCRLTAAALDAGIRQFIHLGCGIPFPCGIHTVLAGDRRGGRVVYVDDDPTVVEVIRQVFGDDPAVAAVEADPHDVAGALATVRGRRLCDPAEPVLVLSARRLLPHGSRSACGTPVCRDAPAATATSATARDGGHR